jgi:hypothetical protein
MTRKLVFLLVAGLVLAPAASAKGPHATISSGPKAVDAGRLWVATLELNEFAPRGIPLVVASRGDRRVTAQLRPVPTNIIGRARFRIRMVLPAEGRWRLAVVAGKRRFAFPAIRVGSGEAPQDYVAFPRGSAAERHGAGGVWTQGPAVNAIGGGSPLPPETISLAKPSRDRGGLPLWIPVLGIALAGAGVWRFRSASGRRG